MYFNTLTKKNINILTFNINILTLKRTSKVIQINSRLEVLDGSGNYSANTRKSESMKKIND